MVGGLIQLVAYGAQDAYLSSRPQITFWKTTYRRHTNFAMEHYDNLCGTCFTTMSGRTYNNFEIIFHEEQLGKEYYSNNLINICPINLNDLNNKSIMVNSEKIIKINKEKLNSIIKRENKLKEEEEKERKKEERRNRNYDVQFFKLSFRNANQVERAQRAAQNRQIKNQMKNQMRSR